MMLQSKFNTLLLGVLLANSAFAMQTICPDINEIKAEGVAMAEQIEPNLFFSYNISKYNTSSLWGFVIAPIEGDSDDDALEIANEILNTMNAPGVVDMHGVCTYETGRPNVYAAAVEDEFISPNKLREQFKKRTRVY